MTLLPKLKFAITKKFSAAVVNKRIRNKRYFGVQTYSL